MLFHLVTLRIISGCGILLLTAQRREMSLSAAAEWTEFSSEMLWPQ